MKTNILRKSAAMCIGAAFALSAMSARADEPKKDDTPTTTTHKRVAAKTARHAKPAEKVIPSAAEKVTRPATAIPTRDGYNAKYVSGGVVGGGTGPEYAVQVGSLIPRAYNRRGYTTDSPYNEFIIDQNDQRFQSSNTVGGVLRTVPGVSIGGMR